MAQILKDRDNLENNTSVQLKAYLRKKYKDINTAIKENYNKREISIGQVKNLALNLGLKLQTYKNGSFKLIHNLREKSKAETIDLINDIETFNIARTKYNVLSDQERAESVKRKQVSDIKSMQTLIRNNKNLSFDSLKDYYDFITFMEMVRDLVGDEFDSDQFIKTIEESNLSVIDFYNQNIKGKDLTKQQMLKLFEQNHYHDMSKATVKHYPNRIR